MLNSPTPPKVPDVLVVPVSDSPLTEPQDAPTTLQVLNTHGVGYAGLAGGAAGLSAVVLAIAKLFSELSSGPFLVELVAEHHAHTFGDAESTLAGLIVSILGAATLSGIAVLAAYFAKPKTIA